MTHWCAPSALWRTGGPDGAGAARFRSGSAVLAHTRLAILDTSDLGHQPMFSRDRSLCLAFNGEIFNFQEIRRDLEGHGFSFISNSDSEVLLAAYQQWGSQCLHRLNGMFAFAVWDAKRNELFIARDRLGIKPLYWTRKGNAIAFASEAKALMAAGLVEAAPDWNALHDPWHFIIGPETGFQGIDKLGAGEFLVCGPEGLRREKWWTLSINERNISEKQAIQEMEELLFDSVRLQMIADVPVGAFLSGGLDSSIITSLMRKASGIPPRTYTIVFSDKDKKFERMPDDGKYARMAAGQIGCDHEEIAIEPDIVDLLPRMILHMDEPLSDPAAINVYLISKAAREQGIRVMLSGMGGDEVFGGYRKQLACLLADRYQMIPGLFRRGIRKAVEVMPVATKSRSFRLARWAKRFLSFAELEPTQRFLQADISLSPDDYARLYARSADHPYDTLRCVTTQRDIMDRAKGSYLNRMCLRDTLCFLTDHNLLYTDKATMAASIEGRPPLIDHRLVEWAFTLPPHLKINGKVQKYILKKVSEPHLHHDIIYRPKAPFAAPLRSWVRGDLSEMVGDILSPRAIRDRGLYDPGTVAGIIREDAEGAQDHSHLIWTLLTRELWFRTFIDSTPRYEGMQPEIRFHEADDAKA